ncbi:gas vesicle protein [Actinomadura sp. HBU206391]|nr:gas vesicle protein [Actinomadura sp. HBU206391]
MPVPPPPKRSALARGERVALVDLLDRLLAGGVVITGDITISIADVDLVRISLRAIIASIRPEMESIRPDMERIGGEVGALTRLDEHRRPARSREETPP